MMIEILPVFHNVRSIHNVGSMFRTADAAGISKVFLTGITPVPFDRFGRLRSDFAKVSLGAERYVKWEHNKSITALIKNLRDEGCLLCAVEQSSKSIPYNKLKTRNKRVAIILGNEVDGLPESILKKCDKILEIPMRGTKESLNVSVAFGIAVYGILAGV